MTARVEAVMPEQAAFELTAYELERLERIKQNNAIMASMGILEQKTLFEAGMRIVKKAAFPKEKDSSKKPPKVRSEPSRASGRLNGCQPEFKGLADDHTDSCDGRVELPKIAQRDQAITTLIQERRCDSQSRGSLYDSKAGITCHFCRQKKLCGETDCQRCSARNPELPCIGKSECSRCSSANGRFCRACLLIRYGWKLEDVREQMAQGIWLCPHCYEEDHPEEAWICNSSICMTRRGLRPTGIAIFDAQQQGFASVAHHVQARLLQHRKGSAQAKKHVSAQDAKTAVASRQPVKSVAQKAVSKQVIGPCKDAVSDAGKAALATPRRITRSQSVRA